MFRNCSEDIYPLTVCTPKTAVKTSVTRDLTSINFISLSRIFIFLLQIRQSVIYNPDLFFNNRHSPCKVVMLPHFVCKRIQLCFKNRLLCFKLVLYFRIACLCIDYHCNNSCNCCDNRYYDTAVRFYPLL